VVSRDLIGQAAKNAARTHCRRGHELAGANLVPWALRRGERMCRECRRLRVAGYREEAKAALGRAERALAVVEAPHVAGSLTRAELDAERAAYMARRAVLVDAALARCRTREQADAERRSWFSGRGRTTGGAK